MRGIRAWAASEGTGSGGKIEPLCSPSEFCFSKSVVPSHPPPTNFLFTRVNHFQIFQLSLMAYTSTLLNYMLALILRFFILGITYWCFTWENEDLGVYLLLHRTYAHFLHPSLNVSQLRLVQNSVFTLLQWCKCYPQLCHVVNYNHFSFLAHLSPTLPQNWYWLYCGVCFVLYIVISNSISNFLPDA